MTDRIRTRNVTSTATCRYCEEGLATVTYRTEGTARFEEVGPCPWCEKGFRLEFPEKTRPHWGAAGYWRGREPFTVAPPKEGDPAPYAENTMRWQLMLRRMTGQKNADPCVGIDHPDPKRRLEMLEYALRPKQPKQAAA